MYVVAIVVKSLDAQMHTWCIVLINNDALSKNEFFAWMGISLLEINSWNKFRNKKFVNYKIFKIERAQKNKTYTKLTNVI